MADAVAVLVGEVARAEEAERCAREAADLADHAAVLLKGINATAVQDAARVANRAEDLADQVRCLRGLLVEGRLDAVGGS